MADSTFEARWLDWIRQLVDSGQPLVSFAPHAGHYLEILLPHANELFPALVQENSRKTWSFWLPPEENEKNKITSRPATASSTLVVTGPNGETLDRGGLVEVLTNLHRRDRDHERVVGLPTLHLGFGVLHWHDREANELRSPLVLAPVHLKRSSFKAPFLLQAAGEGAFLNEALVARLQENSFPVPPLGDVETVTLSGYFEAWRTVLADKPGWELSSTCFLSSFPVFKGALARDVEDHAAQLQTSPVIRALSGDRSGLPVVDLPEERELDRLPGQDACFDTDGSQAMCLEAARRGQSFVLVAAPGTGKSQTLANLATDAMGRGQKVLIVGGVTALARIGQHLQQAGLGPRVLELFGKVSRREVIAELARCLRDRPTGKASDAGGPGKLAEVQDRLRNYLQALHEVREPIKRTVWQVLSELPRWRELPTLPLSTETFAFAEVTPGRLQEYEQLLEQLRHNWHVGVDCPWQGFKGDRFHRQLRDEVLGLIDRLRGRAEKLQLAAGHVGEQVKATAPVPDLLQLAALLEHVPTGVAPHWLHDTGLAGVAQDIDHCATRFQEFTQALAPLTARYGQGVWALPEETTAKIRQAWNTARGLLAAGDESGAKLLTHQQSLRGWASDTQQRVAGWIHDVRTLEKWLGIPVPHGASGTAPADDPSPHQLRLFLRLVHLCRSEYAPERGWVHNPQAVADLQTLLAKAKPLFSEYRRDRHLVLAKYTEQFFELELDRLAVAFAGPYRSWLRFFNGQFRRDRRALARRSRQATMPASAAQDVTLGQHVLRLKAQIESEHELRKGLLGRYENGLDTDVDAAERALRVAIEALEIVRKLGCTTLPSRFVDALCAATPAPEKVRAADKRLQDSFSAWLHATHVLKDVLPEQHVPGSGQPLEECALSALVRYAKDVQTSLNQLAQETDQVLSHAAQTPPDLATLLADLEQAARYSNLETNQAAEMTAWRERLGPGFQGLATDWNVPRQALAWSAKVRAWFASHAASLPQELAQRMLAGTKLAELRELRLAQEHFQQALHAWEGRFAAPEPSYQGRPLAEHGPEDILLYLDMMRDAIGQLADWMQWRHLPDRFQHLGLEGFLQALRASPCRPDQAAGIFWKSFWTAWLQAVFAQEPGLTHFRADEYERLLDTFATLDRERIVHVRQRLLQRAGDPAKDEIAVLMREAEKMAKQMPVPRLLETLAGLVTALKPCWLMNATHVSRLDPGAKWRFDLVLVADADRMPTCEALPALMRAGQVVVAGTAQRGLAADNDDDGPSLIDDCRAAGLPQHDLRWGHGSEHEGLSAFANEHLYHGKLVGFPTARTASCINYQAISGEGDVARAVELVVFHATKKITGSVALIAFSHAHRTALEDELERRRHSDATLDKFLANEGNFALEYVDWLQRRYDVVILSLGNTLEPFFGAKGVRRLHAACTAARIRLVVIDPLKSSQVESHPQDAGIGLLGRFLAAATGPPATRQKETTPLLQEIQAAVSELGYTSVLDLGPIDLAVAHPQRPNEFLLGILLDGPSPATTTRTRARLLPEELRRRGWAVHHVWSPAWVLARDTEIARLRAALNAVL